MALNAFAIFFRVSKKVNSIFTEKVLCFVEK